MLRCNLKRAIGLVLIMVFSYVIGTTFFFLSSDMMPLSLHEFDTKPSLLSIPIPSNSSTTSNHVITSSLDISKEEKNSYPKEQIKPSPPQITNNNTTKSPYAYVFVLGGIHEDRPSYKGFLYNVLITTHILKKLGSKADFWIYIRLSPDSQRDTLPEEDTRLLNAMNIQIKLLEKPKNESFSQLMFDKFFTLTMTDYRRVIYLDADVIPLTNMDYFFHLSDPEYEEPTVLRPNLILSTRGEPCNGGMFMIQPNAQMFQNVIETIRLQHEDAKANKGKYPHDFDYYNGWGYSFHKNKDGWEAVVKKGTSWKFWGAWADQGLIYHTTKYMFKDVSIAIGAKIQNWIPPTDEGALKPILQSETLGVLQTYQSKQNDLLVYQDNCGPQTSNSKNVYWKCNPPYNSYAHFTGSNKPWQKKFELAWIKDPNIKKNAFLIWYVELDELNQELNMGLDLENWNEKHLPSMKESPLGYMPKWGDQMNATDNIISSVMNKTLP